MKPVDLLNAVKSRFSVILNKDDVQFKEFLRQALSTYESKAGYWKQVTIEANEAPLPDDYQQKITCRDHGGYHARVTIDVPKKLVTFDNASGVLFPCDLFYYVNLRDVDLDNYELPHECVRLVSDYLYVLIAIPEFERQARVAAANNFDTSVYPSQDALQAQKVEIETTMSNQMVLPNVKVR